MTLATLRRRLALSEELAALVLPEEVLPLLPFWLEGVRAQHLGVTVSAGIAAAHGRVMDHITTIANGGQPSPAGAEFIRLVVHEMRSIPTEDLRRIAQLPELPGDEEDDGW
jgi:hypothetical protein